MRNKTKKLSFMAGATICVSALAAGAIVTALQENTYSLRSYAEEAVQSAEDLGVAVRGASIRYRQTDEDQGLRFSLTVTNDYYGQLQSKKNVKVGMLVLPYDLCGGVLTVNSDNALNEVFYSSAADGASAIDKLAEISNPATGEEEKKEAVLVLKDIPNLSYNRQICVAGYIEENGAYTYTEVTNTSIAKVAKAAKAAETDAEKLAALENYLLQYTVNFYGWNNELLAGENSTQTVKYGENFTLPDLSSYFGVYAAAGKNGDNIVWSNDLYDFDAEGAKETLGNMYFRADNRARVTVSGSYEYGSGRYDATSGKYVNAGDNVTVKIGGVAATVNTENQTYTLDNVIEGSTYDITVESDYFRAVTLKNASTDSAPEKITLKSPKMATTTGITYGEDGSVTVANNTAALFAGSPATAAGEGFAVKYTVLTNNSGAWFNRGGLHVETNATARNDHDFGFVKNDTTWMIYAKQNKDALRDNLSMGSIAFAKQDEWNVTAVYSDGVYYLSYESLDGNKTYTTALVAQSFTYAKGSEIVDATLTRALGLSCYFDANYTNTFKNISYAIGNEAAKAELSKMPKPVYNVTVAKGTRFALPDAEAKNGEGFVINYTVNDNGCTGFLRRGGLYIVSTENGVERRYRFGTYQSGLYVGSSDEATENRDYYYNNLAIESGKWDITIVVYDGVYYTKFTQGDTVYTKKIDASTQSDTSDSLNDTNKAVIYSKTATRKLWLHSFTQENKYDTKLNKVTYSIGNEAAQAAIAAMGFEN